MAHLGSKTQSLATVWLLACSATSPSPPTPVALRARALDPVTVEVEFTREIDASSIRIDNLRIFAPFVDPREHLPIHGAVVEGHVLTIETHRQVGGRLYALHLGGLRFVDVETADAPEQVNFVGFGLAQIEIVLDTHGYVPPSNVEGRISLDALSGEFHEELQPIRMLESELLAGIYAATVSARVTPGRRFAVRAVDAQAPSAESEVSLLATFSVTSTASQTVALEPNLPRLPEFEAPVDPVVGDGFAPVRIIFDDRFARELARPELRSSLDASGRFDLSSQRLDPLRTVPGKMRVYETILDVAVDPDRRLDGVALETYPYVSALVESDENIPARSATFEMRDEKAQVIVVRVGDPNLVPVTFRVDAGSAWVEPDGRLRGMYPDEGIFLTGEFPAAEDALGRLAADAFSGGERTTLEMRERPDAEGIFEKTIFMQPNRPYGWKVVRCPTRVGCAELNRHVASSGRTFPTVMKNLVTANLDAFRSEAVSLIDPRNLGDYLNAVVSESGQETPSPTMLFKQEVPDLVVNVAREPVVTPIYIVGTWRDINIPQTPGAIIASGSTLNLRAFDYDDGMQGRFPLERNLTLNPDPGPPRMTPGMPPFTAGDGALDSAARLITSGTGRLPLWVGWNDRDLYVATDLALSGRDHFIMVSFDPPGTPRRTPWAKGGMSAAGTRQAFLAMEGDGAFQGWFLRGTGSSNDAILSGAEIRSGQSSVLEGSFDPRSAGMGSFEDRVWIAVVGYGTNDGAALDPQSQNPIGNSDFNVDPNEFHEIPLNSIRTR